MDPIYRSEINSEVQPAKSGEFKPISLGSLNIWPPVILAPMAGVTNYPFRTICRQFGAGLYVSEMITARPLVEGQQKTLRLADFGPDESPRSLQLYSVDPYFTAEAVKRLVGEGRVDHIDMNFGCPVRKVTCRGGGAALPVKQNLLRAIVRAAVKNAEHVPVTIKFRIGVDEEHSTYLTTGKIAEEEGCAAIGLHARTAAQLYDGEARWQAIAQLKQAVQSIPVLGNGDIWEAEDALRMMRQTGCDGVIVGRGCLGRPWLFRDLAAVFNGQEPEDPPHLGQVFTIMIEHAKLLSAWMGETYAMRGFRKHTSWYTKGFRDSSKLRIQLMQVTRLQELVALREQIDPNLPFPPSAMRVPRGKTGGVQKVALPAGYYDDVEDATPPCEEAEDAISGG